MNWSLPYETPEYINKVVSEYETRGKYKETLLNKRIENGKSILPWKLGHVINSGGTFGLTTTSLIYGYYPTRDQYTGRVLVEVIGGGVMWLLYNNSNIMLRQ